MHSKQKTLQFLWQEAKDTTSPTQAKNDSIQQILQDSLKNHRN